MTTPIAITDFSRFAGLRADAVNSDPAALREVARQFEALFLQTLFKNMRAGQLAEPLFGSRVAPLVVALVAALVLTAVATTLDRPHRPRADEGYSEGDARKLHVPFIGRGEPQL